MSDPIYLKGVQLSVDPHRIGISYSGGGPLVLVELGVARAFVRRGIVPAVIAGASAGALAGAAHALDPIGGKGIQLAADLLGRVSNKLLGLHVFPITARAIFERERIRGLGDNAPIGHLIKAGLKEKLGLLDVTIGYFRPPDRPKLLILATDVVNRGAVWFPDETPLEEALIASSAIPGIFPWRKVMVKAKVLLLADGGVVMNQPLSILVEQGCGTLYACRVGSTAPLDPPQNALDNAIRAVNLAMHQATKLEEEYVRLRLGETGAVHHIHPEMVVPSDNFDFTPEIVRDVMAEAEAKTLAWLAEDHPD